MADNSGKYIGSGVDVMMLGPVSLAMGMLSNESEFKQLVQDFMDKSPLQVADQIGQRLARFHREVINLYDQKAEKLDEEKVVEVIDKASSDIAKIIDDKETEGEKAEIAELMPLTLVAAQLYATLRTPVPVSEIDKGMGGWSDVLRN